jgi:hypothetical protein
LGHTRVPTSPRRARTSPFLVLTAAAALGSLYLLGYVVARVGKLLVHRTSTAAGKYSHHSIEAGDGKMLAGMINQSVATFYAPLRPFEVVYWHVHQPIGATAHAGDRATGRALRRVALGPKMFRFVGGKRGGEDLAIQSPVAVSAAESASGEVTSDLVRLRLCRRSKHTVGCSRRRTRRSISAGSIR